MKRTPKSKGALTRVIKGYMEKNRVSFEVVGARRWTPQEIAATYTPAYIEALRAILARKNRARAPGVGSRRIRTIDGMKDV